MGNVAPQIFNAGGFVMPDAQKSLTKFILLMLIAVAVFAVTALVGPAFAAETTGMVAPGTVWGSFADRGLYAVFGAALAFANIGIVIRYGAEIIAPTFDVAVHIADKSKDGGDITIAEAILACGILFSTSFRLAILMLPTVVFAVLL